MAQGPEKPAEGPEQNPEAAALLHQAIDNSFVVQEPGTQQAFLQVASRKAKKGQGFDGYGAPNPFNRNDDDQVDAGQPNMPEFNEDPNQDKNMVHGNEADDDDSFVQVASKRSKSIGFDGYGAPNPFNRNDDDQVDAGQPNMP